MKIVIEVYGGLVSDVYTDSNEEVTVIVNDLDTVNTEEELYSIEKLKKIY